MTFTFHSDDKKTIFSDKYDKQNEKPYSQTWADDNLRIATTFL